jgi:hypothetical protein
MNLNRQELARQIIQKVLSQKTELAAEFANPQRIQSCIIDNLLDENIAKESTNDGFSSRNQKLPI